MSADHLLYQMDQPGHSNEWFDFDNSFDVNSGYLDSDPNSVNSISPQDYTLPFPEMDANWDFSGFCAPFPDPTNYGNSMDHGIVNTMNAVGNGATMFGNPTLSPDLGLDPISDDFLHGTQEHSQYDWASSIRQMVEDTAAADPSCLSSKAKRRDASIAIHLQRLRGASIEREISSGSNTSFSSPSWSDYVQEEMSPMPPVGPAMMIPSASDKSTPVSSESDPAAGGMELVLDLNMNATTNLPKKQKPRSQAQKQNYIKVRKHGACEKHRKQHKRCNCLDKDAVRIGFKTTTATTQATELPRLQKLQVGSTQPGRMLCQPRQDISPGSTHVDRYTCHSPTSIQSGSTIPSPGDCARPVLPAARRLVGRTNATRPGASTPKELEVKRPQGLTPRQTHSVPGGLPNLSIPDRLVSQPTRVGAGIPPRQGYSETPKHPAVHQFKDKNAGSSPTRLDSPPGLPAALCGSWQSSNNVAQGTALSLAEYASTAFRRTAFTFFSFWQSSTSATSWMGTFAKVVLVSCKQSLTMKRCLGLYR